MERAKKSVDSHIEGSVMTHADFRKMNESAYNEFGSIHGKKDSLQNTFQKAKIQRVPFTPFQDQNHPLTPYQG